MNRKIKAVLAASLCFSMLGTAALAHGIGADTQPRLFVNGMQTESDVYIKNGTLYAPLREVCERFGVQVTWDAKTRTAKAGTDSADFSAAQGSELVANRMYTPIREIAAVLGKQVYWDGRNHTALACDETFHTDGYWESPGVGTPETSPAPAPDSTAGSYNEDDVYWLARIIYAEARGESMEGKIAVGNVILNRVASDEFPDSIYDVIFDTNWGVQFEPVSNGAIYCTPDEDCYEAARRALDGESMVGESLYFFNPSLASSFWIANNCEYVTTIGCHLFYI